MAGSADDADGTAEDRTLSRYEVVGGRFCVLEFLGKGGMGEVYEVKDLDINGRFALKLIRPEIADNPWMVARFREEIQLARQVNHHNVCRIYHSDYYQSPGAPQRTIFFTMELLRGKTLAELIRERERLSIREALPIIEQICAGLDAAHAARVVHRDLKPGNIILTVTPEETRAVITDFGLALTASDTSPGPSAKSEPIVGTLSYMAPEQRDGREMTPAADIYSLGVLIYKIVTGTLPSDACSSGPFEGANQQQWSARLDSTWRTVISRCMETAPGKRFPNAKAVAHALRKPHTAWFTRRVALSGISLLLLVIASFFIWHGIRPGPLPETAKHLAIIPFTVIDQDSETQAFADGLTETLAAKLSQLVLRHSLQLVPTAELRAQHITSVEGARKEFAIDLAITGSLHRSGRMIRVTSVLIDAVKRTQIGADTIDFSRADPFALEDRVVSNVVTLLGIKPTLAEQGNLISHGTAHPGAYDYYLLGRGYLLDYQRAESIESAITVLSHALQLDKNYADAQAALGEAYWYKYELSHDPNWVQKAISACERSAKLQPGSAGAHICLGNVYKGRGQFENAVEEFKLAMALDPTDDSIYRGLATAYQSLRRTHEAEDTFKRAISLRPRYWANYNRLGVFYYNQARYDEAAAMFQQVVALAPDNSRGYTNLGGIYVAQGRYGDAVPVLRRAAALQQSAAAYSNLATCYFHLRRFADAASFFERAVKLSDQDYLMWGNLANAQYRVAGTESDAIASYKKAIALAEREMLVNPKDAAILGNLADYYSMIGDKLQALNYLGRALEQMPHDALLALKAAEVYNQLGETDRAFEWLEKAVAAGYSRSLLRDTPALDNLRANERFQRLFENN